MQYPFDTEDISNQPAPLLQIQHDHTFNTLNQRLPSTLLTIAPPRDKLPAIFLVEASNTQKMDITSTEGASSKSTANWSVQLFSCCQLVDTSTEGESLSDWWIDSLVVTFHHSHLSPPHHSSWKNKLPATLDMMTLKALATWPTVDLLSNPLVLLHIQTLSWSEAMINAKHHDK
jgi:hypothetical protein